MPLPGGTCSSVGDVGRRMESGSGFDGYSGHLGQAGFPPILVWSLGQREAAALICASEVRDAPSRARIPSGPLPSLGLA